ncbi:E4 SUMO-protein ligase PIAL2 isoform X1 [Punica granatum]|uniref:E4 SUMO-protein ligase PIAL2 isoform X1 n=2 Tax=Punica granatum TaxID=22663 RepID=A0A6P8DJU1_PUNGR|nr:E4 SUMO-protein ligase PIAL2 isoform X1 [Punica granatum]
MASTAINSPPPSSAVSTLYQLSASMVNSLRVAAVLERLSMHLAAPPDPASTQHAHGVEYYNLLLSLARGIDYAVANNDIPEKVAHIPELLKEICRRKSDACSQALVMVLMISVKNACKVGWFPEKERQELFALFDDVGSCFYNPRDISETYDSLYTISTIFERYYPQMKIGEILATLEVKPGYGAYVSDFHVSKNTAHSPDEKIRLLVAQTDKLGTSACIISPPQVNFLLNGKGVDRRTNIFMDTGPQMPTNVTSMLKYGTNLLQAVGQFNGRCLIALAFMSVTSPLDSSELKGYVSPTLAAQDSDSEIIEGPSRISLNCPISRSRIKVPVKGHSCKHPQCFDFSNFIGINSRRPMWRCPHCNQYVCFTDLCIDQNIAKILKEVGGDVTGVMISADGSWKAVMESDGDFDIIHNKISTAEGSTDPPPVSDVFDLTEDNDEMDVTVNIEDEDTKPRGLNQTHIVNRDPVHPEGDFWSGALAGPTNSNAGLDPQVAGGGAFEPIMLSNLTSPAITDSISSALNNQGFHGLRNISSGESILQSQLSAANTLHLQQSVMVNSILNNENGYGNRQPIPVNVTRTPTAVQALPVQHQTPNPLLRSRSDMNPVILNSSSIASTATLPLAQQQFLRSIPSSSPSSLHPARTLQQATNRSASPALQQRPNQLQAWPGTSTGLFMGFQNQHLQQALNQTMLPPMSQSPTTPRYPMTRFQTPLVQTPTTSGAPHSRFQIPSHQGNPSHRQHAPPPQIGISRPPGFRAPTPSEEQRGNSTAGGQPSPRVDGSGDLASEQNWRPAGRMRGSITGRPFSDEISQLVIQPTQPTRPSGSLAPSNPVSASLSAPPHLRASMSNNKNTSTGDAQKNQ